MTPDTPELDPSSSDKGAVRGRPAANCSVLCKDCRHFEARANDGVCLRPVTTKVSLVTGEATIERARTWCGFERQKVTRLQRLLGCDQCGSEGRHFSQNDLGETRQPRSATQETTEPQENE